MPNPSRELAVGASIRYTRELAVGASIRYTPCPDRWRDLRALHVISPRGRTAVIGISKDTFDRADGSDRYANIRVEIIDPDTYTGPRVRGRYFVGAIHLRTMAVSQMLEVTFLPAKLPTAAPPHQILGQDVVAWLLPLAARGLVPDGYQVTMDYGV